MKSFESIARAAYETFCASLSQFPIETWNEMAEPVRQAWIAATRKMAEEVQQVH